MQGSRDGESLGFEMLHHCRECEPLRHEQISNFCLAAQPFLIRVTIRLGCHRGYFAVWMLKWLRAGNSQQQILLGVQKYTDGNWEGNVLLFKVSR